MNRDRFLETEDILKVDAGRLMRKAWAIEIRSQAVLASGDQRHSD